LLLLAALVVLAVGAWLEFGHDLATGAVARKTRHMKWEQWKQIYDDAHAIFTKHAAELKTKDRITLTPDEVPASIRELGYEEFYATPEGVTYERAGGGVDMFFTAIHCIFDPQSRAYTHKGIWFLGPEVREWVYVTE
jgi:hypothetical protein